MASSGVLSSTWPHVYVLPSGHVLRKDHACERRDANLRNRRRASRSSTILIAEHGGRFGSLPPSSPMPPPISSIHENHVRFLQAAAPPPPPALTNIGTECWGQCAETDGPCAFCGTRGACCRFEWTETHAPTMWQSCPQRSKARTDSKNGFMYQIRIIETKP